MFRSRDRTKSSYGKQPNLVSMANDAQDICLKCNSNDVIEMELKDLEAQGLKCLNCDTTFCRSCIVLPYHFDKTCQEYAKYQQREHKAIKTLNNDIKTETVKMKDKKVEKDEKKVFFVNKLNKER